MDAAGVIPRLTYKVETGEGFFEPPRFAPRRSSRASRHREGRQRTVPAGRSLGVAQSGLARGGLLPHAQWFGERGHRTWSG